MSSKVSLIVALGLLAATQATAHHGAGVFDPVNKVTVTGTVTDFQFVNPHVLVYIDVTGDDGKETKWGGELTSPNRLARDARAVKWHKSILKAGDSIYESFRAYQRALLKEYQSMAEEFDFRMIDSKKSITAIQTELRRQIRAFLAENETPPPG